MSETLFSIHDEEKIKSLLSKNGEPAFRYAQIENAIYKNFITDFEDISTISKKAKELLKSNCFYCSISLKSAKTSKDKQTTKLAFETYDKRYIESVIMRHLGGRNTLCVSCQVGCPMGCMFCETGKLGLKRNLEFYEIIDQILYASLLLNKEGKVLRNIVYMGMGEPFTNYENVKKSIKIVCKKNKLDFSSRRVTISTCGILEGIKNFGDDFPQTSLAI
ncbi:radical SAM protein, partial [Candidatus Gracilibacteria bacterium]|nr:radical SAM protein [Candidatus Gracilibacteria bacterium]